MNKQTFESLAEVFIELLTELEKTKSTCEVEDRDICKPCMEDDKEVVMTPLERLISDRINNHIKEGTFPSLEEAQAIHILDSVNYRYNK